jgi:uncharacterized protein (DUF433 family)
MATAAHYPHLKIGADGVVRIGETRYKVLHLAGEHYHYGWSAEELLRQHTDLRPEEVYSALAYFYDHFEELVAQLNRGIQPVTAAKVTSLSRNELLSRKSTQSI